MKRKTILISLIIGCICISSNLSARSQEVQEVQEAQEAQKTPADKMVDKLLEQVQTYPEEKIYLHTDKPYYSAGDTIWFKAYLVHASLHQPMPYSRYVYVELINAQNQVVIREKVRPQDNVYCCQMALHSQIVPGAYSLRAYTNYMRNLSEDYYFRKEIQIGNAIHSEGYASQEAILSTPYYEEPAEGTEAGTADSKASYDVQFFPEGGNLIAGNLQCVAFKAVDQDGWGCDVHGRIVDAVGSELTQFQSSHLGMGRLAFIAEKGKQYTAVCENQWGEELRVQLPLSTDSTYSIQLLYNTQQQIIIRALTPMGAPLGEELYLLGHVRGVPCFSFTLSHTQDFVVLSKTGIPAGVMQILLMNRAGECLAERLCFIRQQEQPQLRISSDKAAYGKRERAHIFLQCLDEQGRGLPNADLSVSVTSDNCVAIDSSEMSIESYLLLSSDLRGYIEKPGQYFLSSNKQADAQLDLLMLTQGWRRYDIPKLCSGQLDVFKDYELEVGSSICGRLQTYPIRRAIPNAHISIFNAQHNYFNAVNTDNRGRFCFDGFEYADSTSFFVQAEKKQQGVIMELTVEQPEFPQVTLSLPYSRKDLNSDEQMQRLLAHSRDRYYFENGTMTINLDEIAVTAKKAENLRRERGALYSQASYTFEPQDIEDMVGATLIDILLQAPGITSNSTGDGVLLRNATPLIVINNVPGQMQDLTLIQPMDVEMIDILKDPTQTAMYQGGGNGVICIYLKQGKRNEDKPLGSHQKVVSYLGYTSPKEFYQPIYSVEKNRSSQLPDYRTTLFWQADLKSDAEGKADFRFYLGDDKSSCTVLIEGVGPQGEVLHQIYKVDYATKF